MKQSKTLKILSYILLPVLVGIILISLMYIEVKDSTYYNEEKYFESDMFVSSYMSRLSDASQRLIYDNNYYNNIQDKDEDIQICYSTKDEFDYDISNMYFLIIYKNKALTNVELTSERNSISSIKNYILNISGNKNFNIVDGEIEAETDILRIKAEQYLDNFINTYYTRNTKTENSTGVKYITAYAKDFQIYSSYEKRFSDSSGRLILNNIVNEIQPYENYLYVGIPISTVLSILIIVYLLVSVGYKKGVEGIALNDFDKIPLEIILLIALVIGTVPCILSIESSVDKIGLAISSIITAYITIYVVSAISINTIIKRIKSKTFWKTTITGRICNYIIKQFKKISNAINKLRSTSRYFQKMQQQIIIYYILAAIVEFIAFSMLHRYYPYRFIAISALILGFLMYQIVKIIKNFDMLDEKLKQMYEGDNQTKLEEQRFMPEFQNSVKYINDISNGFENAIQDRIKSERLKTELITNVSHDIKTPLTSIINYVDLLKQEEIQNEKVEEYIKILDNKSQRLKKLIEDLVEASKVSTGNISLNFEKINIVELIKQAVGEFEDKFNRKGLETIIDTKENEINIMADSRYMYRIIENLFSNISKYALENSRVYIDIINVQNHVYIEMKNISKEKLNISAEELMQRFVRGDKSRTTEGSGLGISIAQNLTEAQNGNFNLKLDGDLFKVELVFDKILKNVQKQ